MKLFIRMMIASILLIMAAPAWSGEVLHALQCEQDEEVSDEKVEAITAEWLKAAKTIKGGENLRVRMNFPVAAKMGEVDVVVLIVAPSFADSRGSVTRGKSSYSTTINLRASAAIASVSARINAT